MAATCIIKAATLLSICPNCAWTDHSKTHLSAVKSPDNFHPLQDEEKIPELAIKASTLPSDTLHSSTDQQGYRLWTHTCAHADDLGVTLRCSSSHLL